jgi:hypothetical protein
MVAGNNCLAMDIGSSASPYYITLHLAFRVLTGNQQSDNSCISEFRRQKLDALSGLFVQIRRFCQEVGMVCLGHVALDSAGNRRTSCATVAGS